MRSFSSRITCQHALSVRACEAGSLGVSEAIVKPTRYEGDDMGRLGSLSLRLNSSPGLSHPHTTALRGSQENRAESRQEYGAYFSSGREKQISQLVIVAAYLSPSFLCLTTCPTLNCTPSRFRESDRRVQRSSEARNTSWIAPKAR